MNQYIRPEFLKKGDTAAVVAPASALNEESRKATHWKELLESWGLTVKTGSHLYDSMPGEFAGSEEDRAADLREALLDPEVKAIISFRGGYGSMHALRAIDTSLFKAHPKWLVGFSDITVLHAMLQRHGIESIHGAMPSTLGEHSRVSEESLRKALFGELRSYRTASHPFNQTGRASGRLLGGNLTLVCSCLGTPWEVCVNEGDILLIEDVDERMYNLDRMLLTLQQGGLFERAGAVIVGYITDTAGEKEWQRTAHELVREYMPAGKPVLFGFPAGHEHPNLSLYLGRPIDLTITDDGGYLRFI